VPLCGSPATNVVVRQWPWARPRPGMPWMLHDGDPDLPKHTEGLTSACMTSGFRSTSTRSSPTREARRR
jgi:hypothetical protein